MLGRWNALRRSEGRERGRLSGDLGVGRVAPRGDRRLNRHLLLGPWLLALWGSWCEECLKEKGMVGLRAVGEVCCLNVLVSVEEIVDGMQRRKRVVKLRLA